MSRKVFKCIDFEEWFSSSGYNADQKDCLGDAWNAALKEASQYVGYCEGTDFGLEEELKAHHGNYSC